MSEPLFLTPVLHEKMWGGVALREDFGYDIPSETTGEAWVVSGHPHGVTAVVGGQFAGQTLAEVWTTQPQLFENHDTTRQYPLLVKILDAHQDLSVQVHPDDTYANAHQPGELGKTESWYILDAKPDAKIYFGHNAMTHAAFDEMIDQQAWGELLRTVPVKPGAFFYVPAGTLHALGAGVLALETQQSSDLTYRVYDFDRVDHETGQKRALHLADAKAVTRVPFEPEQPEPSTINFGNAEKTTLVEAPYFNVYRVTVTGPAYFTKQAPYTQVTVVDGSGVLTVDGHDYDVQKGQSFILPATVEEWAFDGQLTMISSTPGFLSR